MKQISFLLVLFTCITGSGCGKDEPSNTDAGSGTITAKVNGQNWSSKNTADGAIYGESQGAHLITGQADDGSYISLSLPVAISSGQTYAAADGSLSAQYKPALSGTTSYIAVGGLGSGSVTFSEFSDKKVKGTFRFTGVLIDQNGIQEELQIENGAFDFNL